MRKAAAWTCSSCFSCERAWALGCVVGRPAEQSAAMSTIVEKIKDIEKEIARTQINKATMSHLCSLRAKLAKYRTELIAPPKSGAAGPGEGFDVEKVAHAGRSPLLWRCTFSSYRRARPYRRSAMRVWR